MLCEKYFIVKLSLFFLLQFTNLNTAVAQKFLSPDEFYQSLQQDQTTGEATTLPTELYKPIVAPTESPVISPISNSNNNNNGVPTQPDVRDHRPTANTIETESSANVQNQLANGATTQGGQQAKQKITRQDLSDPFFIRKNEVRESESVSGNGIDNWSKSTSSHKSFEEMPRYPNNDANNIQQNNMIPHMIYAQQRPNIPYPMSRPNNVFAQTNTHVSGPFVPQQTFNSINPSSQLPNLPPHIQSMYMQYLAQQQQQQQHHQQQQPFEAFNFYPQSSPNSFGSFQTSSNDNGNIRTYSWHSSSGDDMDPSSQFNRYQQMSSDPFNAMLRSNSNSGGYRSFSTMGDDGQWHTNVETW